MLPRSHLDSLIDGQDVVKMQGKDSEATTALAFYRMARTTGEAQYDARIFHPAGTEFQVSIHR